MSPAGVLLACATLSIIACPSRAQARGLPTSVSVTAFGARPNDRHDDAAAIERAIQSVGRQGGIVTIPAGTYVLASSAGMAGFLTNGAPVRSAIIVAANHVTLKGTGPATILRLAAGVKMRAISIMGKDDSVIDLTIDGNKGQRDGEHPYPGGDVVNSLLWGGPSAGHVTIRNCEVRNGVEDGIGFWKSSYVRVIRCYLHDNGTTFAGAVGISLAHVNYAEVAHTRSVDNSAAGFRVAFNSAHVAVKDSVASGNGKSGMSVLGQDILIRGNSVTGNGRLGAPGLNVVGSSTGVLAMNSVNDNYFVGIDIDGVQGAPVSGWTVTGNSCMNTTPRRSQDQGIVIGPYATGIRVVSNTCINNGSGLGDQIVVKSMGSINRDWRARNTIRFTPQREVIRWPLVGLWLTILVLGGFLLPWGARLATRKIRTLSKSRVGSVGP